MARSPELGFILTPPPSMGGVLVPLVASVNCAHLRVWELGGPYGGYAPLDLCGVLVRESRATQLDPLMGPVYR
jgi:hypothetical protein